VGWGGAAALRTGPLAPRGRGQAVRGVPTAGKVQEATAADGECRFMTQHSHGKQAVICCGFCMALVYMPVGFRHELSEMVSGSLLRSVG
jgi:hypothetical protein